MHHFLDIGLVGIQWSWNRV